MTELICPPMPEHSLVVLIGPSGAGKSTLAATWPAPAGPVPGLGARDGQ